ncbi:hypothetical protein [Legionella bozemanae]|uniref:Uncharacterized protein n=1 Tax=Legionella bozemanae TaxID=447 RepID=A0A0W0S1E6_LEGBO|nr:hypothetical protein [Legionella bozemanae]KTC77267.1 hypothetical protein Lboz_0220 [Legionella bozemanae]STO34929.1 Uncharacterised protein [Legionella bozemanae]
MKAQNEIAKFYSQLEIIGLEQVKINLAQGVYGTEKKKKLVEAWININKEASDNQHKEQNISIAEEANQIARTSNKISWISLIVSVLAILISSLVAIFK